MSPLPLRIQILFLLINLITKLTWRTSKWSSYIKILRGIGHKLKGGMYFLLTRPPYMVVKLSKPFYEFTCNMWFIYFLKGFVQSLVSVGSVGSSFQFDLQQHFSVACYKKWHIFYSSRNSMNYVYVYSYRSLIWDLWQSCKLKLEMLGGLQHQNIVNPLTNIMSL